MVVVVVVLVLVVVVDVELVVVDDEVVVLLDEVVVAAGSEVGVTRSTIPALSLSPHPATTRPAVSAIPANILFMTIPPLEANWFV